MKKYYLKKELIDKIESKIDVFDKSKLTQRPLISSIIYSLIYIESHFPYIIHNKTTLIINKLTQISTSKISKFTYKRKKKFKNNT